MYVYIYIYILLSHHVPSHPTMPEHGVTTGVTTGAAGVTLRAPGGGILGTSCLAGLGNSGNPAPFFLGPWFFIGDEKPSPLTSETPRIQHSGIRLNSEWEVSLSKRVKKELRI